MRPTLDNNCVYVWFNNYSYMMYEIRSLFIVILEQHTHVEVSVTSFNCQFSNDWACTTHAFEWEENNLLQTPNVTTIEMYFQKPDTNNKHQSVTHHSKINLMF